MDRLSQLLLRLLLSFAIMSLVSSHVQFRKLFNFKYRHLRKHLKIAASKFDALDLDDPRATAIDQTMDKMLELVHDVNTGDHPCVRADAIIDLGSDSSVLVRVPRNFQDCLRKLDTNRMTEQNANAYCLRDTMWKWEYDENAPINKSAPSRSKRNVHWDNLIQNLTTNGFQSPPTGFRKRVEYRALSPAERTRFHNALKGLYDDGTLEKFSVVHRNGLRSGGVHRGAAFLPWHRVFIALFEEHLRRIDPRVSLPYWDSSFDRRMGRLAWRSVMWDEDHLGEGVGVVDNGPFAGWVTVNGPLRRNIGARSGLIRRRHIRNFMRNCRLQSGAGGWEGAHNNVHNWVGGTMLGGYSAAEPAFYLHHCFIDYQWEKFRRRQRRSVCPNVDPATDYPPVDEDDEDDVLHGADKDMNGMEFLKNKDGIADFWTDNWFDYEDTPSCSDNCADSPDLTCKRGRCAGVARDDDRRRRRRQARTNYDYGSYMEHNSTRPPIFTTPSSPKETPKPNATTPYPSQITLCRANPYGPACPSDPPPQTYVDVTDALWLYELPPLRDIEIIRKEADAAKIRSERTTPDSSPKFFPEFPEPEDDGDDDDDDADDEGDYCINRETSVYRYLETTVESRGYFSGSVRLAAKARGPAPGPS